MRIGWKSSTQGSLYEGHSQCTGQHRLKVSDTTLQRPIHGESSAYGPASVEGDSKVFCNVLSMVPRRMPNGAPPGTPIGALPVNDPDRPNMRPTAAPGAGVDGALQSRGSIWEGETDARVHCWRNSVLLYPLTHPDNAVTAQDHPTSELALTKQWLLHWH